MNMKKIDYKKLILYVMIPLLLGGIVGFITSSESKNYDGIVDGWVFPVVWSILYILMGISSYIVRDNRELMNIYKVNLIVNLLWPIIFFSFGLMVLIPYMLWLIFASILNLMEII